MVQGALKIVHLWVPHLAEPASLALSWMDPGLSSPSASLSLALPSSHMHCPPTMPRNVAEDQWSDRAVVSPQTQPCSQSSPTPVCPHSIGPTLGSYWLMVSSAVTAWGALVEETVSFLEAPERRRWIYSQSWGKQSPQGVSGAVGRKRGWTHIHRGCVKRDML